MARDGTNRGGSRPGAGRPKKSLVEKINEGKPAEVRKSEPISPINNFLIVTVQDHL